MNRSFNFGSNIEPQLSWEHLCGPDIFEHRPISFLNRSALMGMRIRASNLASWEIAINTPRFLNNAYGLNLYISKSRSSRVIGRKRGEQIKTIW